MAIYIIRHGQTVWNLEERKQGHSDSPLTLKGIEQARVVSNILRDEAIGFDQYKILISPLFRARQYAQIIFEALNIGQRSLVEPLLKEHGFGAWEGLTQAEVDQKFPSEREKRERNRWKYVIPGGGESYEKISERAGEFLSQHSVDANMIIIAHEMISKVLRGHLCALTPEDTLDLGHPQDVIYKYHDKVLKELTQ